MKCTECHFDNREDAIFCRSCGASLVSDISCPNCEASNPPDSKFCEKCGRDLKPPKASPPLKYSEPQSYTPKFLSDKILKNRSSIVGERKLVTVFFADVANYTSISEKIDPEEVHQIMDGCFKILMDEIHKYEGTINQFTGDGVMALFGAPVAHEDHAQRACYAALSIQKSVKEYGDKIQKDTGVEFKLRIGLNSGPVIVGSIGDDLRLDYTAVGDTTNLASRMESKAEPGSVLVSENIYKITREFFQFKSLGKVVVKGKEKSQEAYELIKPSEVKTRIGASVAKGLIRFVGRNNSMAALSDTYEKVQSGSGQIVGIVGEAGVGKSRLLLEFVNKLTHGEFIYFEGRCLHYGSSMIYMPILDILRHFFDIDEGDRKFIIKKKIKEKTLSLDEKLENTIPSFQELLSLKVDDENYQKLGPKQKRDRTFEAIRDLLIRISHENPLIIAIEDLHWIDKTTEEFIDYLIGSLANTRIMLILLYRPDYSHQWGSRSYYNSVSVNQLGTESSIKLVKAILEGGGIVPEIRDLILKRADGNPLFMEELTHSLVENGTIRKRGYEYILDRKVSDIQVPDTLQGIIAARMDRLEENLKQTMQVASVIGREFAFRILQTITGMREELKSSLINLQGLEFIYEKSLFPDLEYIFKHALTQEVAYNSLLVARRKEIHEKVGKAIEQIYVDKLAEFYEILAYQYSKSGNLEKAYQYSKLSGEKAVANFSNLEAYDFYKKAINALAKMPQTEDNKKKQIEVCIAAYDTGWVLGCPEDSIQIIKEGARLSKELSNDNNLARFNVYRGRYHLIKGDPLEGIKYTEFGLKQAQRTQDLEQVAPLTCSLVVLYNTIGEYSKTAEITPQIIRSIEEAKKETEISISLFNAYSTLIAHYGLSIGSLGNFVEGFNQFKKGLKFSMSISSVSDIALLEWFYGWILFIKGDGEKVVEHMKKSLKYTEKGGVLLFSGLVSSLLGAGYYLKGDLEKARNFIERGIKIHMDINRKALLSFSYMLLGMVGFDSGDFKSAKNYAEKSVTLSQECAERQFEGMSRIWLGKILYNVDSSQIDKSEENILQGINLLEGLKIKPYISVGHLFLGEFYVFSDQREKAIENLNNAKLMFQEMEMDYWLTKTREVLGRL
jgi:class 3 adenylate cyclase/tetratricopeptide (TPR) repeat protein